MMPTYPGPFLQAACTACQAPLTVALGLKHVMCPHCGMINYVPDAVMLYASLQREAQSPPAVPHKK